MADQGQARLTVQQYWCIKILELHIFAIWCFFFFCYLSTSGMCYEAGISSSITPHSLSPNVCQYTTFPQGVKRGKTSQQMSHSSVLSFTLATSAALLFKPAPVCTADHQQAYYSITLKSHSGLHGYFPLPVYLSQACLFIDESKFQLQSALFGCWCWASELISIVLYVISRMAILCLETVL